MPACCWPVNITKKVTANYSDFQKSSLPYRMIFPVWNHGSPIPCMSAIAIHDSVSSIRKTGFRTQLKFAVIFLNAFVIFNL